jgi:RimJ/RimL family protein N-acetyltransferase
MSDRVLEIPSPFRTERLILRPLIPEDLDDMASFHAREDVVRFLYWGPRSREAVREALERKLPLTSMTQEGDSLAIAVVLNGAEGTRTGLIGDISLWWQSEEHRGAEIGYVFNPVFGGHGYATEAVRAVVDLAFRDFGMHRVSGRADARNTASTGLLRRLGMRQEAHLIQNEWVKGEWTDEVIFAILEDEWRAQNSSDLITQTAPSAPPVPPPSLH